MGNPAKNGFDAKAFLAKVGAGKTILKFEKNQHVLRIATTTAVEECVITSITKEAMIATLHTEPKFSELFMAYIS